MTTTDSGTYFWRRFISASKIIIFLGANILLVTANSGLAKAQSTMGSRYISRPNIVVDLSVLEKFGSATLQTEISHDRSIKTIPVRAERMSVQLLSPPKMVPRSQLTIPKSVAIKRKIKPMQKQPILSPKAIPAEPPVVAVKSKPSKAPRSVEANNINAIPKTNSTVPVLLTAKPVQPVTTKELAPKNVVTKSESSKVSAVVPAVPSVTRREPKTSSEQAAVLKSPVNITDKGNNIRILFAEESSTLPKIATGALEQIAQKMKNKPKLRILLYGFAGDTPDTPSKARRLSLFRALAVRTQLMNFGVRSTRMQLRALGSRVGDGPPDRVDIVVSN